MLYLSVLLIATLKIVYDIGSRNTLWIKSQAEKKRQTNDIDVDKWSEEREAKREEERERCPFKATSSRCDMRASFEKMALDMKDVEYVSKRELERGS